MVKISGQENFRADSLAKLAASGERTGNPEVKVGFLETTSIQLLEGAHVNDIKDFSGSWLEPIYKYIEHGEQPDDKMQAKKLRIRSARYVVMDGVLYRRSFSQPLLRCLTPYQSDYILREIHEGICGNHIGARTLAHRALSLGYYWPGMKQDAQELVRKCDQCQRFAKYTQQPPQPMTPIMSPWPFMQWGVDIVGPLPTARGGKRFVVVAVDYFTKWAEAEPLVKIGQVDMKTFIWKNVVCRFGIPHVLISDNGTQFEGTIFEQFCSGLNIKHRFSSPGHPQSNGQAEVTNRTILQAMKKRLEKAKGQWLEELPGILWSYRTTKRTATGESPFSLAYGTEAVLPVEIGMPTARISAMPEPESDGYQLTAVAGNNEGLLQNLDLLEGVREQSLLQLEAYQQRISRFFSRKVKPRGFQLGDLVLRRIFPNTKNPTDGKLAPNWEGPYKVVRCNRPGTYWLEDLEKRPVPRPWHAEHLKKYYV